MLKLCQKVFAKIGVNSGDAKTVSDVLVKASLWGIESHGIFRLPMYVKAVETGQIKPKTDVRVKVDSEAIALLDGGDGFGQIIASRAMKIAISKAKKFGIGACGAYNSNHFGVARYYSTMAAKEGMIGIAMCNVAPIMAPWGGRKATIGNNPISIASPGHEKFPWLVDMANTRVSRGKVLQATQQKTSIPPHWALDEEGSPTTDPEKALKGTLSSIGGPKGYCLAVLIDVIVGVMTGANYGPEVGSIVNPEVPGKIGLMMIAIDVNRFIPLKFFRRRLERYAKIIKDTPTANGIREIYFPGELGARKMQANLRQGVTVDDATLNQLVKLKEELGLKLDFL